MAMQFIKDRPGFLDTLGEALGTAGAYGINRYEQQQDEAKKLKRQEDFARLLSGQPIGPTVPGQVGASAPLNASQIRNQANMIPMSESQRLQFENLLTKKEEAEEQRKFNKEKLQSDQEYRERKLSSDQEKDQRKIEISEANTLVKSIPVIKQQIQDLKDTAKLADSPDLRTGWQQQVLTKFGWGDFARNPTTEVASKLIADINNQSMMELSETGAITNRKYIGIAESNPSLLLTPIGLKNTAKIKELGAQARLQIPLAMQEIEKKYRGKVLPLGAVAEAREKGLEKIEQIHKKQDELVNRIAAQPSVGSIVENEPDPSVVEEYRKDGVLFRYDDKLKKYKPVKG